MEIFKFILRGIHGLRKRFSDRKDRIGGNTYQKSIEYYIEEY
jgi:hypothetical protein